MVLAVGRRDAALLAGFGDSQLSRPFGTLGGNHNLVPQLVVANFVAHICQSLCDVCLFYLASRCCSGGAFLGWMEPQTTGRPKHVPRGARRPSAKHETQRARADVAA